MDRVKAGIQDGTVRNCFAVDFLKQSEDSGFDETQKLFTVGTLMFVHNHFGWTSY